MGKVVYPIFDVLIDIIMENNLKTGYFAEANKESTKNFVVHFVDGDGKPYCGTVEKGAFHFTANIAVLSYVDCDKCRSKYLKEILKETLPYRQLTPGEKIKELQKPLYRYNEWTDALDIINACTQDGLNHEDTITVLSNRFDIKYKKS